MLDAIGVAATRTPTHRDVSEWHNAMFSRLTPVNYYAGGFRQDDPKRPCLARDIGVGSAVGEPYQSVLHALRTLFAEIDRAITSHFQRLVTLSARHRVLELAGIIGSAVGAFIKIHPFLGGNGRTSRVLWNALLRRFGLSYELSVPKRPGPPYPEVMSEAMKGNYAPTIAWVLAAMAGP